MDIIILGKNTDDKGKQLEHLTASILRKLGYDNVSTNEIGVGGNEIDVSAEFIQPSIAGTNKRLVLCECKAYKAPISTNEWMKFLGKIFMHELRGKKVDGCFIALNGANGNVKGQYRELLNYRDDIQLVTGDDLVKVITELFQLESIEHVQMEIISQTGRNILNTCICYYADKIYWLVIFIDNSYSILNHKGEIISNEDSINLQKLISANTDWTVFADLKEEKILRQRNMLIEKFIISTLLIHGKVQSQADLLKGCNELLGNSSIPAFRESELEISLNSLTDTNIVKDDNKGIKLKLSNTSDIVKMFKAFFNDFLVVVALGTPNYNKLVNGALLDEILRIQGNLIISKKDKNEWIKILRWSPSALGWSLRPDPMLANHRGNGLSLSESIDKTDILYFKQQLSFCFFQDFTNKALSDYFFNKTDVEEIETIQVNKFKSTKKLLVELDSRERIRLGRFKASEESSEQIIAIRILEDIPEPWNDSPIKKRKIGK